MGDEFFSSWDSSKVKPSMGFPVLPAGDYQAVAVEGGWKKSKANPANEFLELRFKITGGQYSGSSIFHRFNLMNSNPQAKSIAAGEFSMLCQAIKVPKPKGVPQLLNIPLVLTLKHQKNKETGDLENRVSAFKGRDGKTAAPAQKPATEPQQAPADNSEAPPAEPVDTDEAPDWGQ